MLFAYCQEVYLMDSEKVFGLRVHELRAENHLTQQQLGDAILPTTSTCRWIIWWVGQTHDRQLALHPFQERYAWYLRAIANLTHREP